MELKVEHMRFQHGPLTLTTLMPNFVKMATYMLSDQALCHMGLWNQPIDPPSPICSDLQWLFKISGCSHSSHPLKSEVPNVCLGDVQVASSTSSPGSCHLGFHKILWSLDTTILDCDNLTRLGYCHLGSHRISHNLRWQRLAKLIRKGSMTLVNLRNTALNGDTRIQIWGLSCIHRMALPLNPDPSWSVAFRGLNLG